MKPIWYFVGLILLITGTIVVISGIFAIFNPPEVKTVLSETHPAIWWGALMMIVGAIYVWKNINKKVE
jgi:uncharacterized membrane protein HdeD (DUF308 family)